MGSRILGLVVVGMGLVLCSAQQKKHAAPPAKGGVETKKVELPLSSVTEFSAIMVGGLLGNIDELHVYRSGKLMRTEMLDGNYMVTNLENRDTYVVLPDRCAHDARPSVNTFPFSAFRAGQKLERNLVGTETVDGHECQVEEITIVPELGKPSKMKFWEATDLGGFPVKIEVERLAGEPVTITYRDVKIGKPDAALFKHPTDCSGAKRPTKKKAGTTAAPAKKTPQ